MSEIRSALHRLCEHVGIADGYRDVWGRDHRTTDETRLALLKAMCVIDEIADAEAALRVREEREWRSRLPPVVVRGEQALPLRWHVCIEESAAYQSLPWTITLETGETLSGEIRPADFEGVSRQVIDGAGWVKVAFQLRHRLPTGYHQFRVRFPGAVERSMTLIVVPSRCYTAPVLEQGGRVWGPALQLHAVRSGRNWGMGDFSDLRSIVELMARESAAVVGLNPMHALFPHDPGQVSPYSPSSRNYLNPLYIDVEAIPEFTGCQAARDRVANPLFQAQLRTLRDVNLIDYSGLAAAKFEVLRAVYETFRVRDLPSLTPRGAAFSRFLAESGESLQQFALYHALQEEFNSDDANVWGWPVWPEAYREPESPAVREYLESNRARVMFFAWMQWIADEQFAACAERAREVGMGIGLYRDLAVSVDRAGADAWGGRQLYADSASVGSPPDDFSLRGQDWGLPPVIPERLAESGYAPFIATLRANMKHAGALRIDHVMGLARLYWVPPGATPAQGAYVRYPIHDLMGILALESRRNRCMVIGEDLGTLPEGFREQLKDTGVLSYRVLLFEKEAGGGFKPPSAYPDQALATASTHDLPTLNGYWLGHDIEIRSRLNLYPSAASHTQQLADRERDRVRLLAALEREGLLPPRASGDAATSSGMTLELALAIHEFIARSPSWIMMAQLEDAFGQLEQVNLPTTTSQYPNWRHKLAPGLEQWPADTRLRALTAVLRSLRCADSGSISGHIVPQRNERE